jgi:hypothetical protein
LNSKFICRFAICVLLACGAEARAADPTPRAIDASTGTKFSIAHSALLTLDATPKDDTLAIYIRRVVDQSVVSTDDIAVTVDGKTQSVTHGADGSYLLPLNELRGTEKRALEVVVGHDGIREVLDGQVAVPDSSSAGSLWRDHKQIAWWILNITIVLIAAIAVSRRKG